MGSAFTDIFFHDMAMEDQCETKPLRPLVNRLQWINGRVCVAGIPRATPEEITNVIFPGLRGKNLNTSELLEIQKELIGVVNKRKKQEDVYIELIAVLQRSPAETRRRISTMLTHRMSKMTNTTKWITPSQKWLAAQLVLHGIRPVNKPTVENLIEQLCEMVWMTGCAIPPEFSEAERKLRYDALNQQQQQEEKKPRPSAILPTMNHVQWRNAILNGATVYSLMLIDASNTLNFHFGPSGSNTPLVFEHGGINLSEVQWICQYLGVVYNTYKVNDTTVCVLTRNNDCPLRALQSTLDHMMKITAAHQGTRELTAQINGTNSTENVSTYNNYKNDGNTCSADGIRKPDNKGTMDTHV